MNAQPVLQTKRLILRQLQDDDQKAVFALRSNEAVGRFISRPLQQHMDEAAAFIEKIKKGYAEQSSCYWALALKEDPALIGSVCLWNFSEDRTTAEMGYELMPDHQGRGYMREAIAAVLSYGFETLKLQAIEAFTHRNNTKSKQLLERNGFILCEGRVDEDVLTNLVYSKPRP